MQKITMVVHGGAGTITKEEMTPELEKSFLEGLQQALDAGYSILEKGGAAVEAVKAANIALEDNPLFNAGRGSVYTKQGVQEMDAAIMNGKTLEAGAVAGVRNIRNPIKLAMEVMQNSDHVFLSGKGASDFAIKQGIKQEPDEYFFSQYRYDQWKEARDSDNYSLDHSSNDISKLNKKKIGTIGAVACDVNGNVAAATSTGGMTNKKYGRVGDTPVIGGGTYANNHTCAVSCTGHGEVFIRAVAAYDVSALVEYKGLSLTDACNEVVLNKLVQMQGEGGLIAVNSNGEFAMVFNSEGMYRGVKNSDGINETNIYK
ncbi:asparaginase [Tannerella sp. oral taxon BU063 isolate Cell 6/7/9]|uniref:Isoaspartyl peptidase n=1 Tax=Tannerella sp. oral taxon BU063 isolate Cell 6/7/9 TaxID=1411021 RepID=W2CQ31_9BACT|nr:asparaginase [Tannerella sp. oral taxon BU063 isolate Cell 6/7/9]